MCVYVPVTDPVLIAFSVPETELEDGAEEQDAPRQLLYFKIVQAEGGPYFWIDPATTTLTQEGSVSSRVPPHMEEFALGNTGGILSLHTANYVSFMYTC
jgi:hypothetical protein